MTELLRAEGLKISYGSRTVLQQVSFALDEQEVLAIVGESGSGKSTLLRGLCGLLPKAAEASGGLYWYGLELRSKHALLGNEISFVFQDAGASFCPVRRLLPQLTEGLQEVLGWSLAETRERSLPLLAELGLPESVLEAYPWELSGGMLQRVGILAALLPQPRLLLADEPTAALDTVNQAAVVRLLKRLCQSHGLALIIVTHHLGVAKALSDQLLVLKEGRVVEQGKTAEVLSKPRQPYTQALLRAVPRLKEGAQNA